MGKEGVGLLVWPTVGQGDRGGTGDLRNVPLWQTDVLMGTSTTLGGQEAQGLRLTQECKGWVGPAGKESTHLRL